MPQAPELTPQQRAVALEKAAAARSVRARVRAELKAGELSLAELFDRSGSDQALATMRVTALLESLPGYGKVRAADLLAELRIASSRRVRGLGPNQRAALLARIERTAQSRI
ncbi:MAG: integration host factor, actinobacterial type [Jatrophihabitantaceae bacterium]